MLPGTRSRVSSLRLRQEGAAVSAQDNPTLTEVVDKLGQAGEGESVSVGDILAQFAAGIFTRDGIVLLAGYALFATTIIAAVLMA